MKRKLLFIVLIVTLITFAACGAPQEDEVVGGQGKNISSDAPQAQNGQTETEQAAPSQDAPSGSAETPTDNNAGAVQNTPSGENSGNSAAPSDDTPTSNNDTKPSQGEQSDAPAPGKTETPTLTDGLEYEPGTEVRWFGRTHVENDTYWFNYTDSGFEFSFYGTGAEAIFTSKNNYRGKTDEADHTAYIKVYVDGGKGTSVMIGDDMPTVTLASKLKRGNHTIRVVKRTNARSSSCGLYSLTLAKGGKKLPPPTAKTRKIEFIGDSLTVGYGAIANASASAWSTKTEDGTVTYAALTAEKFNAEMQVVAVSGRGIVHNIRGDTDKTLPQMFRYTDIYNSNQKWDYSRYQPDAVVINAGGNDGSSGLTTDDEMRTAMTAFVAEIRKAYPKAHIFLMINPNRHDYSPIYKSIAASQNNVHYVQLPTLTAEQKALGHPNVAGHKAWAAAVQAEMGKVMGWK